MLLLLVGLVAIAAAGALFVCMSRSRRSVAAKKKTQEEHWLELQSLERLAAILGPPAAPESIREQVRAALE